MVLALAAAYVRFGGLPWMRGAFYGIGATVIAIIARSATNLLKKTLKRNATLWAIAVANAAATAITESEVVWLLVGGGVVALAVDGSRRREPPQAPPTLLLLPAALVTGAKGPATALTMWKLLVYFATAGAFVFGSGLAIVPFLHGGVVTQNGWLDERQFLDAVAVAMITPGPVVITVAFIGFLVAGPLGACVAAVGVFLPCFVITVVAAPHFHRWASRGRVRTFVDGVTAAAVGAIAGAVVVLARKSLVDATSIAIALVSLGALVRFKKVPEPLLILAAGMLGIVLRK
jgi:chromate transporter